MKILNCQILRVSMKLFRESATETKHEWVHEEIYGEELDLKDP